MKYKGKRYRYTESKSKETKIKRAIFITVLSIIVAGIVCVVLFNALFKFQSGKERVKSYSKSMTSGVELVTSFAPTHPTHFVISSETAEPSTKTTTQKPTQATTQKPTQSQTTEPPEPTEELKQGWLIDIDNPDYDYSPEPIYLTDEDRYLIAKTVMREFGDGGYEACCLQAQAFRDAMVFSQASAEYTYQYFQYDAYPLVEEPNSECYDAVDFIFGGNMAVPHRVLYMYSPEYVYSAWHESQTFVVEYNGIRFFDLAE